MNSLKYRIFLFSVHVYTVYVIFAINGWLFRRTTQEPLITYWSVPLILLVLPTGRIGAPRRQIYLLSWCHWVMESDSRGMSDRWREDPQAQTMELLNPKLSLLPIRLTLTGSLFYGWSHNSFSAQNPMVIFELQLPVCQVVKIDQFLHTVCQIDPLNLCLFRHITTDT